jgi:predicted flap endonuclease-1-like 5' DNA nuclease
MHVRKYLVEQAAKAAKQADESAGVDDEAMSQQKKPIDDLSVLVGIGHEILLLLKCIIGLVCLVLFGIVYIVSRL